MPNRHPSDELISFWLKTCHLLNQGREIEDKVSQDLSQPPSAVADLTDPRQAKNTYPVLTRQRLNELVESDREARTGEQDWQEED
jgi:hypothetical protein